jgi:hypothetical protein
MKAGSRAGLMDWQECLVGENSALVEFIMAQAGLTDALLRQHRSDGTGHCAVCSTGGQAGRYVWPCQIAVAALAAAGHRTSDVA